MIFFLVFDLVRHTILSVVLSNLSIIIFVISNLIAIVTMHSLCMLLLRVTVIGHVDLGLI